MAADIYFDGPEPPEGRLWCAICVMLAKQRVTSAEQALVSHASRSPDDSPAVRVNMAGHMVGTELEIAVTRTISTVVPQFGALDVCWSHALGLSLKPGGVAPASPQEAAMFSQAVPLGRTQ
jgi:hypothetical protein